MWRQGLVLAMLISASLAVGCASGASTAPRGAGAVSLNAFSPTGGGAGQTVTITGQGFARVRSVQFHGVSAHFSVQSGNEITATVPFGASSGPLAVRTGSGSVSSRGAFILATTTDCTYTAGKAQYLYTHLDAGRYILQTNEFRSSAPLCLGTDGHVDFTVLSSSVSLGSVAAYVSIWRGCHWGYCTTDSGLPLTNSALIDRPGTVTTSVRTSVVGTGMWDDAYDIWFSEARSVPGNSCPTCMEMMIWLDHLGSTHPAGVQVRSGVRIDGLLWNVWRNGGTPGGTVTYDLAQAGTALSKADLGPFVADAVQRGYMPQSWYLIDVEQGYELWHGGAGLTTSRFAVCTPAGC